MAAGEELLVIESMKMEISVKATIEGVIEEIFCAAGKPSQAGDLLVALRPVDGAAR